MEFECIECPDDPKRPWLDHLKGVWRITLHLRFACSNPTLSQCHWIGPFKRRKSMSVAMLPAIWFQPNTIAPRCSKRCIQIAQCETLHVGWNGTEAQERPMLLLHQLFHSRSQVQAIPSVFLFRRGAAARNQGGQHSNRNHHGWKAEW